jgi:hypothetical protein
MAFSIGKGAFNSSAIRSLVRRGYRPRSPYFGFA